MSEVVRKFVYEDEVIVVTSSTSRVIMARDDNGVMPSTKSIIDGYAETALDLFAQKAGFIENVYSPDGCIKRGVRVEVVSVRYENGEWAYVSEDIINALMLEGRDYDTVLMKVRRKQAAKKHAGYGVGASIGESMENAGFVFTQLPTASPEDMAISAWNHSGSARVAAKAKARLADKRAGVSTPSVQNAVDALFALEV